MTEWPLSSEACDRALLGSYRFLRILLLKIQNLAILIFVMNDTIDSQRLAARQADAALSARGVINHFYGVFFAAGGPPKRFLPRGRRNPLKRLDSEKEIKVNSKKNPTIFQTIPMILGFPGKFQGIPRLAPSVSP